MNAQIIEDILNQAKVDKNGIIMNKGRLNDMLHSEHLKAVKNCSIPVVVRQSEQFNAIIDFAKDCDLAMPNDVLFEDFKKHKEH